MSRLGSVPLWLARKTLKLADRLLGRLAARAGVRVVWVYLERIGEIAGGLDVYVKMGELGWRPRYRGFVVAPPERVANRCYLGYWRRHVPIVESPLLTKVLAHATFSPHLRYVPPGPRGDQSLWDHEDALVASHAEWERQGRAPVLTLTEEHAERGRRAVRELGVPDGAWFACLHVREPGYLQETSDSHRAYRNTRVETYLPAIQTIVDRGGWVIKLGDPTMTPLPSLERVIDYPHLPARSDWLDVYLAASCRFFLGTTSGMVMVAYTFGVPVAGTNWVPFSAILRSDKDAYIPKLNRRREDGRLLSFEEMLAPGLFHCHDGRRWAELGLEIVDNSEQEIVDLTREMLDRLDGTVRYTDEDERLQDRFRRTLSHYTADMRCRVGRDFLREHAALLPPESAP